MGAIRYSCPIRLVPTYILPVKDIRLLGKFQSDSFIFGYFQRFVLSNLKVGNAIRTLLSI